ncbi:MAG: P-loop NTPase [Rickettsiales bacterium]|nr:P-loop NTPase [Rickettsiales bacterium]
MDKLEKALQKAREQREARLHQQAEAQQPLPQRHAVTPEDVQKALPVPVHEDYLERYHIVAHRMRDKEADIFRLLRTQVLTIMAQSGYRTLGITSANYGDGKTTVALNLAISIALDQKQTVLLADMDLRKPSVTEYLGIEPPHGISDYYAGTVPLSECLIRPAFDRLNILPAGRPVDNSSEILGSPRITQLARELRSRYPDRIIIYDLPPTLAQDDPIAFLPHVDAVLLVVNDGVTRISEVKRSMTVLGSANVIGTVLNNSDGHKKGTKREDLLIFIARVRAKIKKIRAR